MSRRLDQYKGTLDAEQTAHGINAAIRNARRLARDADLLLNAGRYPSAAAMAILSIEESGKLPILREIALTADAQKIADCWRSYRSHTKKNIMWLLPQLAAEGARKLDDFRALFDEGSEHPYILDQIKQIGFYSDCLGDAHWSVPEEVIDENLARVIVSIAHVLTHREEITAKEIELWIKHLGPVWMASFESMEQGLQDWYTEMQALGLAPTGQNKMEQFIHHGIEYPRLNDEDV